MLGLGLPLKTGGSKPLWHSWRVTCLPLVDSYDTYASQCFCQVLWRRGQALAHKNNGARFSTVALGYPVSFQAIPLGSAGYLQQNGVWAHVSRLQAC